MKTLTLLLVLLSAPVAGAYAQEGSAPEGAIVESADVSGLPLSQLSPGLRQTIEGLVERPLNSTQLTEITDRIEAERPDTVAAVRTLSRPNGKAQVIFLVARISDDPQLVSNINTRYTVERVTIEGAPDATVSQTLRDELQTMVGQRLDIDRSERLRKQLAAELTGWNVERRTSRGTEPGKVVVVYDVKKIEPPAWLRFAPSRSKILYQQGVGWTGVLDVPLGGPRNHRFTLGAVFGDKDTLIEDYRGYRLRFESRKLGSRAFGASLEFSSLRQKWDDRTVAALALDATVPDIYRKRRSIEPLLKFAFNPYVRVGAGVSTSELVPLEGSPSVESRMANVVVTEIATTPKVWRPATGGSHRIEASYGLRATSSALDSDFAYKRHFGEARYEFGHRRSTVIARASFGHITGQAPIFERFSLGDTTTLRGWNKFDIAPLGGRNLFHQTIEYRFHNVGLFLDAGSVWEPGTDRKLRLSTGFGYQGDNAFAIWGVPLNADKVSTSFMLGVRF